MGDRPDDRDRRGAPPAGDPPAPARRRALRRDAHRPDHRRRVPPRQVPLATARLRRRDHRPSRDERPAADRSRPRSRTRPHLRVRFTFTDGGPQLRFVDQRTFGGLSVSEGGAELPAEIAHIARDPMDPLFDDEAFVAALRRKHTEVKRALLDQTLISGVGNIYADEALWRARLHGARPTDALDPAGRTPAARSRPGRAVRGDRGRRDQLRRAVRQCERARAATSTGR